MFLTKTAKADPLHAAFAVCNLQSDCRALQLSSGAQAAICICNLQAADAPALQRTEPTRPLSRRLRQFVKFLLRGHLLRPVLKPIAQAVRRRELSSNVQLHAADIELCCREKACGSHDHAIDEDKRLPVRNDRAQPHSAHALRVSAFAKGATQRVDPDHVLNGRGTRDAHADALLRVRIPAEAWFAMRPARLRLMPTEALTRDVVRGDDTRRTRNGQHFDHARRASANESCKTNSASLQLAACRMQIAGEASSSVCRILDIRGKGGARRGGEGGVCFRMQIPDCRLPCMQGCWAGASLQIPDCKCRLQQARERGAAGLGAWLAGESADLILQRQTLLVSAESNLQIHTCLALK